MNGAPIAPKTEIHANSHHTQQSDLQVRHTLLDYGRVVT